MMPATICKEITIQAPAAHVWQFVGTEAGLRQWWQMDVTLEAKAGGRCSERGLFNGVPYHLEGIVTTYDPPRQLALLLTGKQPGAEWSTNMNITITLEDVAGTTVVRVAHQMSAVLPVSAIAHQPQPVHMRPIRHIPTILNQLPGQPQQEQGVGMNSTPHANTGKVLLNPTWTHAYEACWTARLLGLVQLTSVKEEN